jgi:hypothetical protein
MTKTFSLQGVTLVVHVETEYEFKAHTISNHIIKEGTLNRQYNMTDLFLNKELNLLNLPVQFIVNTDKAADAYAIKA